jgi:putative hydrolase of the HAD superfamily
LPATTFRHRAVREILSLGKAMLEHPVELLPGVVETLQALDDDYTLLVITKGDLFDQERKLIQSGLADHFAHVEIVSDKTPDTYRRIFDRHGQGTARAMMIGNSLKSDILPALEAGSWAVHVPHDLTWALEHADEPAAIRAIARGQQ